MVWIQVSLCFLSLAALGRSMPGYATVNYKAYPKYSFEYGVNDAYTGDIKQHTEHRDGDVVKGVYSLVEPDGSVRQVEYTADPVNGFNAVVLKSQPTVHAAVVKPVAVPPQSVAIPKPIQVAIAPGPLNYVQSIPVHYNQEQIVAYPSPGHDPYNAFLASQYYNYGGH